MCGGKAEFRTILPSIRFSLVGSNGLSLNETSLFQSLVSAVLRNGLERPSGQFDLHIATQFGDKDPLGAKVRREGTLDRLDELEADATLLFRETAMMNSATDGDVRSCDTANFSHGLGIEGSSL